jgi:hypothetical protein
MITTKQRHLKRLRATCASLLLLLGCLVAPVSLAIAESDTCSMACCVEQRRCCCSAGHAFVRSLPSDGRDEISHDEIAPRCPEGCVNSQANTRIVSRDVGQSVADSVNLSVSILFGSDLAVRAHKCADLKSSSPRAPPAYPIHLAIL